ncbi:MAG: ankyrin repeat domain-containing protein [Bacteroidota bacterium]
MRGYENVADLLLRAGAQEGPPERVESRWVAAFEPVDLALWADPYWTIVGDVERARDLAGSAPDLVIASALGDGRRVSALLAAGESADYARPNGKRALSAAVEYGRSDIISLLLQAGADPNAPEGPMAPRGAALHAAARRGELALVDALLSRGADPNAEIEASGSATFAAATPEVRMRLLQAGGRLSPYDLVWLGEYDEAVDQAVREPASAALGCGSVFAAVLTLRRGDVLRRLLKAGVRPPERVDGCRAYFLESGRYLERLLSSGLSPDLPDWQGTTLLHECCARDRRGRRRPRRLECAAALLSHGAELEARDVALRSRPLGWAARFGVVDMAELLLSRGAAVEHADDPPWATPKAWARRMGHSTVSALLDRWVR